MSIITPTNRFEFNGTPYVISFNDRVGEVELTSADVTTALGYVPGSSNGLWGGITGVLANQTDLQNALNAKLDDSQAGTFGLSLLGTANVAAAKTLLAYTKSDLSLGSVDNTADAAKNVLSATKLTTARNINGVSFDGTGNITINAVDVTDRVPTSRLINTTAPITGGGDLSADRTIAISAATSGAAGSMSAADKTKLDAITGTNTGNQTTIVGITGTLSEFNTALTGDDFASGGGTATGTNTGDQFTNTTASKLLGRGSAGGAGAAQEITLGTNLSISGTTLNAATPAGGPSLGLVQIMAAGTYNL